MKIKNIHYSLHFKKALKKFTSKEQAVIKKKMSLFWENPANPQLKTHKLKGVLQNYWSFSINYYLRVMFEFIDEESIGFIDIGTHEIYK